MNSGAFSPTDMQRHTVRMMVAGGIQEAKIVTCIRNEKTNAPITPKTLRKHFRFELDNGLSTANSDVVANLFNMTKESATAAIFWLKTRARWKESVEVTVPAGPQTTADEQEDIKDAARRVAFCLAMGASLVDDEEEKPRAKKSNQRAKEKA